MIKLLAFCDLVLLALLEFSLSFVLPLGYDICGDPENDPPQSSIEQQQGKQFDHVNPITSKSNILFSIIYIHALLSCVKLFS